jgi:predicted dehydrogenase
MKFAVVGAGEIGRLRAKSVLARRDCQLVGVSDPNEAAAKRAAAGTSTPTFVDHITLLERAKPEVIICAAPVHEHEPIVRDALRAGCHVLCEKPLTPTSEAARRLIEQAKAANRSLWVGFNHRYYPAFSFVKQCLVDGLIGRVDHFRAYGGHDGLKNFRAEWMYKSEFSGGGAMMDVGIHLTDLVRFTAGEITRVQAVTTNRVWNVRGSEDNALAIFETAEGTPILYQATWSEWVRYEVRLEAYGDRGMVRGSYAPMTNLLIQLDRPGGTRRRRVFRYPELILKEKIRGWQSTTLATFDRELADLLKEIGGTRTYLGSGEDGARAIEIAEECNVALADRPGRA